MHDGGEVVEVFVARTLFPLHFKNANPAYLKLLAGVIESLVCTAKDPFHNSMVIVKRGLDHFESQIGNGFKEICGEFPKFRRSVIHCAIGNILVDNVLRLKLHHFVRVMPIPCCKRLVHELAPWPLAFLLRANCKTHANDNTQDHETDFMKILLVPGNVQNI